MNILGYEVKTVADKMHDAPSVITCGVGKSHDVARLAASLLRTVGVKATGVHATDVRHGDLNFLEHGSVLLAVSNSGMTEEVILAALEAKKVGAYTMLITGDQGAWSGEIFDVYMRYKIERDGSKHGTIPTISVMRQLDYINAIVVNIADRMTLKQLHKAHRGGELDRVYTEKEKA